MKIKINLFERNHEPPTLPSLQETDDMWELDLTQYEAFISDITGVSSTETLSLQELQTIQSRLEGCIESYTRDGECKCHDLTEYSCIDSFVTVRKLAQFFRVAVENKTQRPTLPAK